MLTLTARHFSEPRGRAYPVILRHPEVLRHLSDQPRVLYWNGDAWRERASASAEEVRERGDGRCFLEWSTGSDGGPLATLLISLPGNIDPRCVQGGQIVRLDSATSRDAAGATSADGPLLIIGPQRSGTTALQTALDASTRFTAPRDVCMHPWNTLEGFFSAQSLWRLVNHPLTSPMGNLCELREFRTGVFDDSGMTDAILNLMARHVDGVFRLAACGSSCWVDKSPGWEPVMLAPIFRALFPTGRVVFMTRRAESCVVSIVRLEGRLAPSLGDTEMVSAIGRNCGIWVMAMYLWRTVVNPLLEASAKLVVSMESLRERESSTLGAIGAFLSLDAQEQTRLPEALHAVPLPRHSDQSKELDPAIPALISALCRTESQRWGFEEPTPLDPVDVDVVLRARQAFELRIRRMLEWFGVKQEFIAPLIADMAGPAPRRPAPAANEAPAESPTEMTETVIDPTSEVDEAARNPELAFTEPKEEEATSRPPRPIPGPLLAARLAVFEPARH